MPGPTKQAALVVRHAAGCVVHDLRLLHAAAQVEIESKV